MICTFCSVSPAFGSSFSYAKRTDHVIFDAELAFIKKKPSVITRFSCFSARYQHHSQSSTWCVHRSEIKEEPKAGDIRGGGCALAMAGTVTFKSAIGANSRLIVYSLHAVSLVG